MSAITSNTASTSPPNSRGWVSYLSDENPRTAAEEPEVNMVSGASSSRRTCVRELECDTA